MTAVSKSGSAGGQLHRGWLTLAAILGALAVMAGAFGAHGLEGVLSERYMQVYQTAVQYQMYHAIALALVASLSGRLRAPGLLRASAVAFTLGILLFSGSLYGLVLSGVTALGALTPLGGLALIAGWLLLALAAWRGAAGA